MNLIQRATNITLTPAKEWELIAPEVTANLDLFKNYIIPLSLIPLLASFIGSTVIGVSLPFVGNMRTPIGTGVTTLVLGFVLGLLSIYLISLIINALAPSFGAEKNSAQALKVTAYSFTPAWLAGALNVIPALGMLGVLASLYSIYVLYLGLPALMKSPKDRALGYTLVSVICSVVLSVVMGVVTASVVGVSALTGGHFSAAEHSSDVEVSEAAAGKALGQLASFTKKMEAVQKAAEAQQAASVSAEPAATPEAQTTEDVAQIDVLGAAKLKALLPESLGTLKRVSIESEKSAASGYEISKAQAQYADESGKNITLIVGDYGSNIKGGYFNWLDGEVDNESAIGYEKTGLVDGRQTHEISMQNGLISEYSLVVAKRFVIEAHGQNADVATLKAAIAAFSVESLEALSREGMK